MCAAHQTLGPKIGPVGPGMGPSTSVENLNSIGEGGGGGVDGSGGADGGGGGGGGAIGDGCCGTSVEESSRGVTHASTSSSMLVVRGVETPSETHGDASMQPCEDGQVNFDDLFAEESDSGGQEVVQVPRLTAGLDPVKDVTQAVAASITRLALSKMLDMNKLAASLRGVEKWSRFCGRDCIRYYRDVVEWVTSCQGLGGPLTYEDPTSAGWRMDDQLVENMVDERGCYLRMSYTGTDNMATVTTSKSMAMLFMGSEEFMNFSRASGLIYFYALASFIAPESLASVLDIMCRQAFETGLHGRIDLILNVQCAQRRANQVLGELVPTFGCHASLG